MTLLDITTNVQKPFAILLIGIDEDLKNFQLKNAFKNGNTPMRVIKDSQNIDAEIISTIEKNHNILFNINDLILSECRKYILKFFPKKYTTICVILPDSPNKDSISESDIVIILN